MNSLKNLLIMAVLGAVGYGVYVSLARNNVDPAYPPGAADPWQSAAQNPDMSGATQVAPGGSLPTGSAQSSPGGSLAIGSGMGPQSPAASMTQPPSYNPPNAAPSLTPATPYPSSAPSSPTAPDALAGKPMASPSAPGGVQNLAPPPSARAWPDSLPLRSRRTTIWCRPSSPPSWTRSTRSSPRASWPRPTWR